MGGRVPWQDGLGIYRLMLSQASLLASGMVRSRCSTISLAGLLPHLLSFYLRQVLPFPGPFQYDIKCFFLRVLVTIESE